MKSIYNKLVIKDKCKKLLCVETEKLNIEKHVPKIIRNFILKSLLNNEKVIIFIDSMMHKDIINMYGGRKNLITNCFKSRCLNIEYYDVVDFGVNPLQFLHMLNIIAKTKEKLHVIWDFKSISKRFSKLSEIKKCVEDIFSYSNKNVCNVIYMYNIIYDFPDIESFLRKFDDIVIENKNSQVLFSCPDEIDKAVVSLKYSERLKCEDNAILSFNNMFCKIPRNIKKNKFKDFVINELVNVCDADFCIIHTLNNEENDVFSLDVSSGITKEYKTYLTANIEKLKFRKCVLINANNYIDESVKKCFKKIGIKSCAVVYAKYYNTAEGFIYVGRYHNYMSEFDLSYIQSICKAAFCIIQHQYMNFNLKSKLIENEKSKLMGEIGGGIAHDINNILTPIIGCTQLLKDKINDRSLLKQLKIIEICAYDGMNITSKVKKIFKQCNKSDTKIFDIDDLITDAVELTKNKWLMESAANGIKIGMSISLNSKAKIKGNSTEIREVFINIIRNCVDAMPSGGIISISSKCVKQKVILLISDNGIGMSKEVIEKVFDPFFTTKGNKGSGLGLSVSYEIIRSHDGFIRVFSKENAGTTFEIELPISTELINVNDNLNDKQIDFNGSILIIDDRPQIRSVVADMIKSIANCKVKSCGCEDIEQEIHRRRYDIVICDFCMPDINGLQVASMVKDLYKDSYFCLMTGWIGSFKEDKISKVDFILSKPISKEKIIELFTDYNRVKL